MRQLQVPPFFIFKQHSAAVINSVNASIKHYLMFGFIGIITFLNQNIFSKPKSVFPFVANDVKVVWSAIMYVREIKFHVKVTVTPPSIRI